MELVENGTIYDRIKGKKVMNEDEAFTIFIQVCNAIYFLHSLNLVHRDLKPENLLLNDLEQVKLCDFGWCTEVTDGPMDTVCGTYEYMAPEIIQEKPYSLGVDIWSLGILLYELLHGYSPFRVRGKEDDHRNIFKNIMKNDIKFERPLSSDCTDLIYCDLIKSNARTKRSQTHWYQGNIQSPLGTEI